MITVIVTSYKEPKATIKAVRTILEQNSPKPFRIIISDPFPEVKDLIKQEFKNNPEVQFFLDPGEGKSECLNLLLEMYYSDNKNDILIFTDGDVFLGQNSIKELLIQFQDQKVGLVCGHPVPLNSRDNMYGYWSHLFFDEMNSTRIKLSNNDEFFRITGYLFAFRNGIINEFPRDTNEDKVIPSIFWNKGYRIVYAPKATVHVLNPQNMKDYLTQKVRNIKGGLALQKRTDLVHEKQSNFLSESLRGLKVLVTYPKNIKEFIWTLTAMYARLLAWSKAYYETKIKKKKYHDGWRVNTTDSTKPMD